METKSLLIGIVSFMAGGLLVSTAAVTFEKSEPKDSSSMSSMVETLRDKQNDAYDQAFIAEMIKHHEGAVEMAKLSASKAKHEEIKKLSEGIITTQENEIKEMKSWQQQWGFETNNSYDSMSH